MRFTIPKKLVPMVSAAVVAALLYAGAALAFKGFFSARVFLNLFSDNAVLGIAAIGLTFVILLGGIDLSVGALVGFTSILLATLLEKYHLPAGLALPGVIVFGALWGGAIGCLIHFFRLPPFLVTLAAMFLARGMALVVNLEAVPIENPTMTRWSAAQIPLPGGTSLPMFTLLYLGLFLLGLYLAHFTRFGRDVYAVGGNEQSAILMGVPVGRTKILTYLFSGCCSTLAGIAYILYTLSGNASAAGGLELDGIAAVVIGGTLLSGGIGYVSGTILGVLILGIIQVAIIFQGTLSSWWTRIAIGGLLLLFILLQKAIQPRERA